jgi:release factor glutamine methyltransferase
MKRREDNKGRAMSEVTFDGLVLATAPGLVMTPRMTSERLVAESSTRIGSRAARVVDVGTGSGAIAIAIAARCLGASVWATDIDRRAVALARANVLRHRLDDRVFVRLGDLLAPVPAPVDLIVANLPYLAAASVAEHADLRKEPLAAVFTVGDGLDPYRRLVEAAPRWLAPDGMVLLQLHRRIVVAGRGELPALGAALSAGADEQARGVAARFAA